MGRKPSRIHSALRNRRWQVLTATVFLLLIACWWGSHQVHQVIYYRFKNTSILVEIVNGTLHIGEKNRGFECIRQPDGWTVEVAASGPGNRYEIGSTGLGFGGISISFMMAAFGFVAVQYLVLPKSLPGHKGRA